MDCADWFRGGHLRLQNKMLRWKIWDQQSLCLRQTSLRDAVATTCTNHVTPAHKKYWLPDCKKYWLWNVLSQTRPLSVSFLFRTSGKSQICDYIFFDCDIQAGSTSHNQHQSSADNFEARKYKTKLSLASWPWLQKMIDLLSLFIRTASMTTCICWTMT